MREIADQLAVRLLLLEQALLAGDLELLLDVAELEQQRGVASRRSATRCTKMQARLAADAELELLLGVRRAAGDGLVDRGVEARRIGEQLSRRVADQMLARDSSNRFSAAGLA